MAAGPQLRTHSPHWQQSEQLMQRRPSDLAISSVKPSSTSAKPPRRSSAARTGICWRGMGRARLRSSSVSSFATSRSLGATSRSPPCTTYAKIASAASLPFPTACTNEAGPREHAGR